MPFPSILQIPNATNLFIDANILVYALQGRSAECITLLERCSREEVVGICSYSMLCEATHQFMIAEARVTGHIPAGQNNPARYLKKHPEIIRALTVYWTNAQRLFSMNLLFLESEVNILRRAQVERQNVGILTTDSTTVGCMREYGINVLATGDDDFDSVNGIRVFKPTDVIAV